MKARRDMPAFHETLRRRRLEVGMGEGRASQLLGLTTMGYYDLEAYEDEGRTVVPLYITMFALQGLRNRHASVCT